MHYFHRRTSPTSTSVSSAVTYRGLRPALFPLWYNQSSLKENSHKHMKYFLSIQTVNYSLQYFSQIYLEKDESATA